MNAKTIRVLKVMLYVTILGSTNAMSKMAIRESGTHILLKQQRDSIATETKTTITSKYRCGSISDCFTPKSTKTNADLTGCAINIGLIKG